MKSNRLDSGTRSVLGEGNKDRKGGGRSRKPGAAHARRLAEDSLLNAAGTFNLRPTFT